MGNPLPIGIAMKESPDDRSDSSDEIAKLEICPQCGSTAGSEVFSHTALVALLTIWPFLPVRRQYSCGECEHFWKRFGW